MPLSTIQVNHDLQSNELSVVHLEKHTRDLACELWLLGVNLGVKSFTKHLLLLFNRNAIQRLEGQATRGGSTLGHGGSRHGRCTLSTTTLARTTLHRHAARLVLSSRSAHPLWWHALHTASSTTTEALNLGHRLWVVHTVWHTHRHALGSHGEIRRDLLVGAHATTALLAREATMELGGTAGNSWHGHSLSRERHSATTNVGNEGLLSWAIKHSRGHELRLCKYICVTVVEGMERTYRLRHSGSGSGLLLSNGVAGLDASLELQSC